jgi:hypothetical protein
MRVVVVAPVLVVALALLSCDKATRPSVTVTARFYNGASPSSAGSAPPPAASGPAAAAKVPIDGRWILSPDRVTLTLTNIRLGGGPSGSDGGSGTDVSCSVVYDKSKPGLTQLSSCNFAALAGTFDTLYLTFDSVFTVVINDAVNGLYSTSTGILIDSVPPNGGGQPMLVTAGSGGLNAIRLPTSLVVADSSTASSASVVINGLQFLRVDVSGGIVTLGWSGAGAVALPMRPDLIGMVSAPTAVEYYVAQGVGTSGGYCAGSNCPTGPTGITAVGVYYASATTPAVIGMQTNGVPATCGPIGEEYVNDPRGYQGLDAAGNLGWAISTDPTWATYSAELKMARVSSLGGTTTLYCKTRSTNPAPAGGSYASGAPTIATAANSLGTYVLVAK